MNKKMHDGVAPCAKPHTRCAECGVRKLALFRGVPEDKIDWTESYRDGQYQVNPKTHLFYEGDEAQFVYTLYAGWAMMYKSLANGKRQVLRFMLPGDFIGFQPDMHGRMSYGVQSLTELTVCAFPRKRVQSLVSERLDIATAMMQLQGQYMAQCQLHLMGVGRKSAKERIAYLLIDIWHRMKSLEGIYDGFDGSKMEFPIAQEEIGDSVGLTTVHVNRTIRELKEDGLIQCANRSLCILDEQGLADLGQFDLNTVNNSPML